MGHWTDLVNGVLYSYTDEMPSIYSLLDSDARGWPYYEGDRVKQRKSIRDHVRSIKQTLANGGYATISATGGKFTLSIGDGHTLSGYSPHVILAAYLAGVPVLDFREVSRMIDIVRLPLPVIGGSSGLMSNNSKFRLRDIEHDMDRLGPDYPSHASYVPLSLYLQKAKQVGASIHYYPSKRSKENHYFTTDYPEWIASRRRDFQD